MVSLKQQALFVSPIWTSVECFILGISFINQNYTIVYSILFVKLVWTLINVCKFLSWIKLC